MFTLIFLENFTEVNILTLNFIKIKKSIINLKFVNLTSKRLENLSTDYPNLHLILVNPQNQSQTAAFTLQNLTSIHSNSWYNPIRNTVIYSFGFAEKVSSPTTQLILDAYVKRGGHNIIVIDWSAYNGVTIPDYYPAAIEEMKVIGRLVGTRIASAFNSYMILKFHLVG